MWILITVLFPPVLKDLKISSQDFASQITLFYVQSGKYSELIDFTLPSDIVSGSVIPKISVVGELIIIFIIAYVRDLIERKNNQFLKKLHKDND